MYWKKYLLVFVGLFYLLSIKITYFIAKKPIYVSSDYVSTQCQGIVVLGGINDYDRILKGLEIARMNDVITVFSGVNKKYENVINTFELKNIIFERKSTTTFENAKNSNEILKNKNITNICLITSNVHLYRATKVFGKFDLNIKPIVSSRISSKIDMSSFLPRIKYLQLNINLLYEYVAIIYYEIKERI